MAVTDFSSLKSAIAGYMARTGMDAQIENAISLFESAYNTGENSFFAETSTTLTTTVNTETVSLPADYRSTEVLTPAGQTFSVKPVSLKYLRENQASGVGAPSMYAPYPGSKIAFNPIPDAAYQFELIYRQKVVGLSSTNTTNWLLARWPHMYVYGALMFMLEYVQNPTRKQEIRDTYALFSAEIEKNNTVHRLAGDTIMRPGAGKP